MSPTPPEFNHVVAFEVSKHELVVHILPADTQERIANTGAAVRRVLRREHKRNLQQQLVRYWSYARPPAAMSGRC